MSGWFVSQRRHRREFVALAESYRRRIEDAERRARKAEERFNDLVRPPLVHRDLDGTVSVIVRIDPFYVRRGEREVIAQLTQRIAEMLLRLHEDWRREPLTGRGEEVPS